MQGRGGGGRDPFFDFGDPFASFGGFSSFGGQRSLLSNFFGGRNPFDDPFFTLPFGGMFESGFFGPEGSPFGNVHPPAYIDHEAPKRLRGPIIEELDSDEENGEANKEKRENLRKHGKSSKEPYVEEPDEAEVRKRKHLQYRNEHNGFNVMGSQPQGRCFTFQSSNVTYGGANGAYYTSSKTRRTGSDGVTIEESKEADTATRQATHRVSRGLLNKGHSVKRKLNSNGKVETMQTLHNLHEDELAGFEEAWKGKVRQHLPGWSGSLTGQDNLEAGSSAQIAQGIQRGWALPSTEQPYQSERVAPNVTGRAGPSNSQNLGMIGSSDVKDKSSHSRWRARD